MWISLSVLRETKIIWGRDVISDGIGKLLIFVLIMHSVTDELQQCVNDKKWHQNYVGNLLYINSYFLHLMLSLHLAFAFICLQLLEIEGWNIFVVLVEHEKCENGCKLLEIFSFVLAKTIISLWYEKKFITKIIEKQC